ncbi:MAG: beta-N-acetylhexosaminidase [Chitinophagaceae bacterium]
MRWLTATLCILFTITLHAQQPVSLIPAPVGISYGNGHFRLQDTLKVYSDFPAGNQHRLFIYLQATLLKYYGITVIKAASAQADLVFHMTRMPTSGKPAYQLTVDGTGIRIASNFEEPAFHALQTLLQLLPADPAAIRKIPAVTIFDYSRFAYRGMHLDVSRHFFPVSFVKRYIDYLALHKLNYFHWHLTDDQGWRIEIKKYPGLTTAGAYRNGTITGRFPGNGNDSIRYGGYYTQEEVKEVVQYAADRFITVIPEIEMPGHSSAAITAYPQLSCFPGESTRYPPGTVWSGDTTGKQVQQTWGVFEDVYCAGKENTFSFLQDVLDEVITLFPAKYIHVGGDECPKDNWKRCPRCQQRMKENGLKNEHELQSYFIRRMEKYLNGRGRTIIGWDEILEGGLAPNAVVMSWRGEQGGIDAARQQHHVIMTPTSPMYFDYSQSENEDSLTIGGYNPLEKVYAWEPIPKELNAEEAGYILGAQANLWTEYSTNPGKVEYMIFPRLSALSEVLWSPKEKRNWTDFEKRLLTQFKRYELWGAHYSKAYYELKAEVMPAANQKGVIWRLSKRADKGSILAGDKTTYRVIDSTTYDYAITDPAGQGAYEVAWIQVATQPLNGHTGTSGLAYTYLSKSIYQQFHFNKATGKPITLTIPASRKYPGDGAFTLVNGVQNETRLARAKEFLGFDGTDCEAIIDLGKETAISSVTAHVLHDPPSWIWGPAGMSIDASRDGNNFSPIACSIQQTGTDRIRCEASQPATVRYVKVRIQNKGAIPDGYPGAGTKPWLFVDEIEVD